MTVCENLSLYSDKRETRTTWKQNENGFRTVEYIVDGDEIVTEFPYTTVTGKTYEVTSEMTKEAGTFIIPVTVDGKQYAFTLIVKEEA